MSVPDRVRELIEPALMAHETEVVDIELGHGLLRVTIDRPGGVDLNSVTDATQEINRILDETEPIADPYTLEVSSPGIERPLRTPAHFQRFIHTQVNVKTKEAVNGARRFSGVLESADDQGIVVDGVALSYNVIDRARIVADWNSITGPSADAGADEQIEKDS